MKSIMQLALEGKSNPEIAPNGRRYELCFRRFVSMERLHVIGQKLCVRPLDGEALLDIAGGIDGRMTNSGSQHFSEGDKRLFKGRHMQYSQTTGQSKIDFDALNAVRNLSEKP